MRIGAVDVAVELNAIAHRNCEVLFEDDVAGKLSVVVFALMTFRKHTCMWIEPGIADQRDFGEEGAFQ